ncbi:Membrane-bound lytic murein transglycosylase B [Streptoalloteichus tenebrarius]|uniref:Membrane-bound lytic murein transglycosylase B n=1 Tax=Streptoalloteichus tenebrarius (strain ATCC 17920 / DSM 40477 / JCM 4838 / CBS 697.72 / NBRC 16177 / NCIMB 11028 / NRRL B-12390 / A12253. 1 / ISP 5477) TaxID=1933 RepID=A0ABT1HTY3_STRSD|nr:lytic murein transglycosylase [Streptoalloteichus tenebrarius]MCP2258993.1 Membrane-bound lytic murein transglycosylase B [Streptoalloteichus tenebrarius]
MPRTEASFPSAPPSADPRPPRRRTARLLGRLALVAFLLTALLAVVAGVAWVLGALNRLPTQGVRDPVDPAPVEPGSAAPAFGGLPETGQATAPDGQTGAPDPVGEWARRIADRTGAPARALRAYVRADLAMRAKAPACRISWATLAGIGRVESDHGRWGGATLGDDGRPSKPIIGVALDGSPGLEAIPDTDQGRLDGDTRHDRAVGPMQFIPATWAIWATDGNGDGVADPQNIDDAAMTAARYLCANGRDLSTGEGWWSALRSYNNSVDYGQRVFGVAERYARASTS